MDRETVHGATKSRTQLSIFQSSSIMKYYRVSSKCRSRNNVCTFAYIFIMYLFKDTHRTHTFQVHDDCPWEKWFAENQQILMLYPFEFWNSKPHYCTAAAAAAAAKSLQSCPTLCDPIDGSPPGSAIPGILQVRTLEWVAISFSNAWKRKVKVKSLSCVRLLATPWTAAYQALLSMGFSRREYWSGLPLPSPIIVLHILKNEKWRKGKGNKPLWWRCMLNISLKLCLKMFLMSFSLLNFARYSIVNW